MARGQSRYKQYFIKSVKRNVEAIIKDAVKKIVQINAADASDDKKEALSLAVVKQMLGALQKGEDEFSFLDPDMLEAVGVEITKSSLKNSSDSEE